MQHITKLQERMLAKIILNECTPLNGNEPQEFDDVNATWADMVIETPQDKGTFTSLVNAGLAYHEGDGRDALVSVTEQGYTAYKEFAAGKYGINGRPL
jgi:RecA-family ATPase